MCTNQSRKKVILTLSALLAFRERKPLIAGQWWIPLTKVHWCRVYFNVMTSLWPSKWTNIRCLQKVFYSNHPHAQQNNRQTNKIDFAKPNSGLGEKKLGTWVNGDKVWNSIPVQLRKFDIKHSHYNDVTMGAIASQITSLTIVYLTVYSDVDQRKHQSSASLAFVRGIHRGPVNSPHKWPVTRKMLPFDDVIMNSCMKKHRQTPVDNKITDKNTELS